MSEITPDLVRHLGVLSRIQLSDEEIERLTGQLDVIVDNIAKVSQVATPDVPATSHPIPLENVYRADEVGATLTLAQALQNAPDAADGRFRVTAILGEEQ
ncbi:MAG: Asp-tRNA(Asn)/Glu-tRNA(Gln) amidotransferase subunit GatC [Microbacterium sp.]|uniref:Asp-tRNA(Asn)/Glu-tRNA(Gln) amidotransferase subunit GatC n=1 Tax=Microbacterium sp. TaxID=51671 RepID=UPI001AC2CF93|nr:Asp-tRNA(Asn)/Glu-tRNA(Gln) amidotransferase subunit GatC [Microbacterium sp.]MBN9152878.1 Asp-tRNA(Asn)/Glu-tRNA(Gln) amidotransferase subunit GatC [Microbacterium sp.]MBN9168500.1 Asp-tRNA(Asn)/Glu-tRNA(Gln) amidotransferase subunit GatC [Microbacterium sp.]MBN9170977.1 Asp-tRNA(Asn)/Glu-tRNA(Gln) amidotransferase subunit GatC [Microbacterium sp.]MBN9184958.1 Asp-tRNA(Asn)/Glu-tRNA(Gln) amidotransferase subunit GatC [Microbacterium sp.]MBN9187207.1 Asp-tRNA(Asn)/Glu-tRNA(Gln) amidotransfe